MVGTKAMLYGAGVPDRETMKNAPQVGIASVWWEGNPCKYEDSQFYKFLIIRKAN